MVVGLFRRARVGLEGRPFELLKLRSMAQAQEGGARITARGDSRVTSVGRWLRATKLDEVPSLWNVVRGDLSLVGPRPERPEHIGRLAREIPGYHERHAVKPGLTGWAQVNGWRGDTDLNERIKCDIAYIERANVLWDFVIMAKTFFSRQNAY